VRGSIASSRPRTAALSRPSNPSAHSQILSAEEKAGLSAATRSASAAATTEDWQALAEVLAPPAERPQGAYAAEARRNRKRSYPFAAWVGRAAISAPAP